MPWGGKGDTALTGAADEPTDHVIINELPGDLTEARLKEIFGQYGNIKWAKLSPGIGGKAGTSSAILELDSVDEATYFVTDLNENIPEGLTAPIKVRYKPAKAGKGGKTAGKGAGGFGPILGKGGKDSPGPYTLGGKGKKGGAEGIEGALKHLVQSGIIPGGKWQNDENTVFVSGLPADSSNNDLLKMFSPFGAIASGGCHCPLNPDGTAKGSGIINFLDLNGAEAAIAALSGSVLPSGTYLKLRRFTPKGHGPSD